MNFFILHLVKKHKRPEECQQDITRILEKGM